MLSLLYFFVGLHGLLCSLGWLKLTVLLLQHSECWDCKCVFPHPAGLIQWLLHRVLSFCLHPLKVQSQQKITAPNMTSFLWWQPLLFLLALHVQALQLYYFSSMTLYCHNTFCKMSTAFKCIPDTRLALVQMTINCANKAPCCLWKVALLGFVFRCYLELCWPSAAVCCFAGILLLISFLFID